MQVEQFNVKDPFKKAGAGIKKGAEAAGGGIKGAAETAGAGIKKGAGAVGNAAKNVGGFLGGILGKIWGFLKMIFKNWKSVLSIACCVCFLSVAGPFIGPLLGMGRAASSLFGRSRVRYNNY